MSLLTDNRLPTRGRKMEDSGGSEMKKLGEDKAQISTIMDQSTMQCPWDRKTAAQTCGQTITGDTMSLRSDFSHSEVSSWTESERELKAEQRMKGGVVEKGVGLAGKGIEHLRKEEEEAVENYLPEKAAQVFGPAAAIHPSPSLPKDNETFRELESERSPFLDSQEVNCNQHGYQFDFAEDAPPARCVQGCPGRDALKVGVSLMTSALLFPFLVWGGFVFLPFDAPLMNGAPLRLVYTLRCSVFAAAPIVLGWLVLGVSRLRSGAIRPFFVEDMKEAELQEVAVHQRFISDSTSLFLIYFLQLAVMAMYLTQEQLKLVPLLTIIFAFGRLAYWVAAAFGSSVRGFGFGFSFLPSIIMMAANFYFIFSVEAAGSIFRLPPPPEEVLTPPAGRQRFWG